MDNKQLTKRQQKNLIHIQIWISGLIATSIYIILMYILTANYKLREGVISFFVFYGIWVGINYIIYNKRFKSIDET